MTYDILLSTGHIVAYEYEPGEDRGDGGVIEVSEILAMPDQHIIGTLMHNDGGHHEGYLSIKPEHVVAISRQGL